MGNLTEDRLQPHPAVVAGPVTATRARRETCLGAVCRSFIILLRDAESEHHRTASRIPEPPVERRTAAPAQSAVVQSAAAVGVCVCLSVCVCRSSPRVRPIRLVAPSNTPQQVFVSPSITVSNPHTTSGLPFLPLTPPSRRAGYYHFISTLSNMLFGTLHR